MSLLSLTTPRGDALLKRLHADPQARPWDVYPRPQLVREDWINLNGSWDYTVSNDPAPENYGGRILVPFPPESSLSGVGAHAPEGSWHCYRLRFSLDRIPAGRRLLFHCGGADQLCVLRFNGVGFGSRFPLLDGEFVEELTGFRPGENEITLSVQDDLRNPTHPSGKQSLRRGGMWYTPVSGIWQTVWLEWVPETWIASVKITPDLTGAAVEVLASKGEGTFPAEGFLRFEGERIPLQAGRAVLRPKEPRLWTPEDPHLYDFSVVCGEDAVRSYFALRTVGCGVVDGIPRLLLNGKPRFFHGLLDQGWWPDGLWTPADPACFEDDLRAIKALGFDTVRKHIKVEPELFYYACDRLGVAVFQDMVNNGRYGFFRDTLLPTLGLQRLPQYLRLPGRLQAFTFAQHMKVTVRRLYNHPAILYWTVFNEGWGQRDGDAMYDRLKALDPTRIVDTTSGWFRVCRTDVDSRHVYFRRFRMPRPKKPVVLSEYGGYVWKVPGHSMNPDRTYGYRLFSKQEEWQAAVEVLLREQIAPAIRKGLCAAIYTQLSDVEDETNGLLTYDRRVNKAKNAFGIDTKP